MSLEAGNSESLEAANANLIMLFKTMFPVPFSAKSKCEPLVNRAVLHNDKMRYANLSFEKSMYKMSNSKDSYMASNAM